MGDIRVMTWNVQNLFEAGTEFGPKTQSQLDAKLRSLAATIDEHEPHVVALQEVGSAKALGQLQSSLGRPMPHSALGVPDGRGIRVAYLSTRVLRDVASVGRFPFGLLPVQSDDDPYGPAGPPTMNQMGRAALRVTVRANNRDLAIVNCHFKSKLLSFPDGRFHARNTDELARYGAYALFRRASEAAVVRSHANAELVGDGHNVALLVVGDLNDEVNAATTQIMNGPPGSEIGTAGFAPPDKGDGERLWNLAPLIPEDERFSRIYRGRGELIDHIFASHFLVHHVDAVRTHTPMGAELPSIDDSPGSRTGAPGSDHAAVMATFTY